jgi:hypothetical protein
MSPSGQSCRWAGRAVHQHSRRRDVAGSKGGLYYVLLRDHGAQEAARCLNRLAKLCARFLGGTTTLRVTAGRPIACVFSRVGAWGNPHWMLILGPMQFLLIILGPLQFGCLLIPAPGRGGPCAFLS